MNIDARFRLERAGFTLDVDLSLPARGVTALFGASGSGKTTLLRCIAGLERADGGRLCVGNDCWQDGAHFLPTHRRPLGYVFQDAVLFPHLTVRGNLDYGRSRVQAAERRVPLEQAVEPLGIGHLLDRRPDGLSGGERQRVAIARALATSPRLLLMDEPLAALDEQRKTEILPWLEKLHDELEIPVLYVSHSLPEVARLADHLVLLDAGRAVADGPLNEMLPRLDLPLSHGEEAFVVVTGTVGDYDADYALARLDFAGQSLLAPSVPRARGGMVRVRIQARDVSLAKNPQHDSSILNTLSARIVGLEEQAPGRVLARLDVGGTALLARLTRKSADVLQLAAGQSIYAQLKSVALLD